MLPFISINPPSGNEYSEVARMFARQGIWPIYLLLDDKGDELRAVREEPRRPPDRLYGQLRIADAAGPREQHGLGIAEEPFYLFELPSHQRD
jgi:hypothetical protein